jgi:hypothetical protein
MKRSILAASLLLAALTGCRPVQVPAAPEPDDGPDPAPFSAYDLEYEWRGVSDPLHPFDRPLEMTLGFDAYGSGSNAVALTRYTFPHPWDEDEIVEYHELIDTYDLFLYADGRFILDTTYDYAVGPVYVVEKVFKELSMNETRDRMEGLETIHLYENGVLTLVYEGWLTLERQP